MKKLLLIPALAASALALAKLPPLDDAAKAKAAEAAAKAAWQAKVDAFKQCKVEDQIAAKFHKSGAPMPVSSKPAASMPESPKLKPPASAPAAASAKNAASSTPTPSVATAPTPSIPPCADPGPFAYTPPDQKPIEASEAHSPAGKATSPPSQNKTAGEAQPAKK
jgi:hypothetical protein